MRRGPKTANTVGNTDGREEEQPPHSPKRYTKGHGSGRTEASVGAKALERSAVVAEIQLQAEPNDAAAECALKCLNDAACRSPYMSIAQITGRAGDAARRD